MAETSEHYAWKEIPGSSHDLLRQRIRALPAGLRLLDLGAAGGHLGRAVRDRCAYLAGVEPDPALPASAREGYDDWRATDALAAGTWKEPFDAVVCADVLEHLPRPEALLQLIRGWLRGGGTLFVSLPNVANVTVRAALAAGRFPYADRGILDRTHLRFYTRRTAPSYWAPRDSGRTRWPPARCPTSSAFLSSPGRPGGARYAPSRAARPASGRRSSATSS